MILPFVFGYLIGRFVGRKTLNIIIGLFVGVALGLSATYTLIPLMYPIFTGDAGLVVIPELRSIGIMILTPDFVVFTETVYMFTRPYIIDIVFALIGAISGVLGSWYGSIHRLEKITTVFD
ncbi:MAG: hypothetical protein ACFFDQ_10950 [Candidatus Thorarchaeota archaeon]